MKLQHLFAVNLVFALFFGAACAFLPRWIFGLYEVVPDGSALWVGRLVGGSILGFATLMWFGFKVQLADTRKAIARALVVQDTVGFFASLEFQLTANVNLFGWFSLALYGFLAIAYTYFLILKPENC